MAGENPTRLADLIRDDVSAKPFESAFALALQDTLAMVLDKLNEREMRIIKLRFGLDGEGPFSPERSGTLPVGQLITLCFSGEYDIKQVKKMSCGEGGLRRRGNLDMGNSGFYNSPALTKEDACSLPTR